MVICDEEMLKDGAKDSQLTNQDEFGLVRGSVKKKVEGFESKIQELICLQSYYATFKIIFVRTPDLINTNVINRDLQSPLAM